MELISPPEVQPLRECVDPPIILPFPEAVDSERLPGLIEFYRDRLAEAGFRLEPCEHLSEREILQWILRLLQEEVPVEPEERDNLLRNVESCPDCWREAAAKELEAPLKEAEEKIRQTRRQLEQAEQALENDERFDGLGVWPPGANRFLQLAGTLLDRMEEDIDADRTTLLEGDPEAALRVMCGLEALRWLLAGVAKFICQESGRAYECFKRGARMARILAEKPPDDHPGRLYRDLGFLVPDAELYTNFAHNNWREREELLPDPPAENCTDAQAWANFYYTESSFREPFFKDLLESEPTAERLESLHENWKQRQQSIKLINKRDEAISKQVLLQSQKFDPARPDEFFNRDYSYLNFFRKELEDMDAKEATLAVVFAQMDEQAGPEASKPGPDVEPPTEVEEAELDQPGRQLKQVKEQLLENFAVETYDEVDPLSVVLIFLVDLSLDWLDHYYTYLELSETNVPERGVYLLTAQCVETALEWLKITENTTYREEFEEVEALVQEKLRNNGS